MPFVNQTDVRIAIAGGDLYRAALELKWSRRVHGDSPRFLLERIFDGEGEPAGYQQITGAALLSPERCAALEKLPAEFSFKEARLALGRTADPTNKFLNESRQLGLIEKLAEGPIQESRPTCGPTRSARLAGERVEYARKILALSSLLLYRL